MPCWTAELLEENISAESEERNKNLNEEIIKAVTLTTLTGNLHSCRVIILLNGRLSLLQPVLIR